MQNRLRAHHLLCIPLFQGYGYSNDFSVNMEACIRKLCSGEERVLLTDRADDICARCPNLMERGKCRQSEKKTEISEEIGGRMPEKTVTGKDRVILERLGLRAGEEYDFSVLLAQALETMDEEEFERSCHNCRWYAEGLCSFEDWKKGTARMTEAMGRKSGERLSDLA